MASRQLPSVVQTKRFEEKRELILNAAALLFNERGVKGATFAAIAGKVGLVPNSVTYYYRKKEDLASACFLRATAALDRIAAEAGSAVTIEARVQRFLIGHAELLADMERGDCPPIILFNELHALPEPHLGQVYAAYTALFRKVRRLLRGPRTESLSRDELTARAHLLLSVAHWMRLWISHHEPTQYRRIAERLGDVVLLGISIGDMGWQRGAGEHEWRLAEDAGGTVEAFLRAATRLVNEQGYEGASIAKISALLNLTKGAFYHHHENKNDLIEACFERTFSVMRRTLDLSDAAGGRGWDRLRATVCALIRFQLAPEGPLLRAAATSAMPDSAHRNEVRRTLSQLTERIAYAVVDGMVDGSIRSVDPSVTAHLVVAGINATAEARRWIPGLLPEEAVRLYAPPLLLGLLTTAPSRRAETCSV
jgi:AcrR family transcriptional regulator